MNDPVMPPRSSLQSQLYSWDAIEPKTTATGASRPFFKLPTATLDQLSLHVTTLNPGQAAHAPHRHPEEEMIILQEGSLQALHNGETKPMSAGSVLLLAPHDLHGVRNVGSTPATYYVIKWFTPATHAEARHSEARHAEPHRAADERG